MIDIYLRFSVKVVERHSQHILQALRVATQEVIIGYTSNTDKLLELIQFSYLIIANTNVSVTYSVVQMS